MTNGFFTEADAREHLCPEAREACQNCQASNCMAWRWKTRPVLETKTYIGMDLYLKHPEAFGVEEQAAELKAAEKAVEGKLFGLATDGEMKRLHDARNSMALALERNRPDGDQFVFPQGGDWMCDYHDMVFNADLARWELRWTRDIDPDAIGYCGACPVKPEEPRAGGA